MINIYTDGGYSIRRNVGAFAFAVIKDDEIIHENYGQSTNSTNNKMEMKAVYQALLYAQQHPLRRFTIFTDSQYVFNALTAWMPGWIKNDWKGSTGKDVLNREIWEVMYPLFLSCPNVTLEWVKGHVSQKVGNIHHKWNNYVDDLCTECMSA
jgi:ribonuclease HI